MSYKDVKSMDNMPKNIINFNIFDKNEKSDFDEAIIILYILKRIGIKYSMTR